MRYRFIHEHRDRFRLRMMCRVLGVSPSGYYAWRSRPESTRSREDRRLKIKIRASHKKNRGRYGAVRIHADLREDGETCGRHRVARLMRESGLVGAKAKQFKTTTNSQHSDPVAPNVLDQDFSAEAIDQVWVADITYLRTRAGWCYLAVVLDLYSRLVVGWALRPYLDAKLTLAALEQAVARRQPGPGLLHHSDRGSQYTCRDYQSRLEELGMVASMSRTGNCYDNAVAESFFDSLKTEIGIEVFKNREHAQREAFEYLEVYYNQQRRHSALGLISPAAFERRQASEAA